MPAVHSPSIADCLLLSATPLLLVPCPLFLLIATRFSARQFIIVSPCEPYQCITSPFVKTIYLLTYFLTPVEIKCERERELCVSYLFRCVLLLLLLLYAHMYDARSIGR